MKKLSIVLSLLLLYSSASNAAWTMIGETSDGKANRLLVDQRSVQTFANNACAVFVFAACVDIPACDNAEGWLALFFDVKQKTPDKRWWKVDGGKMFDIMGDWVCEHIPAEPTNRKPLL